MADRIDGVVLAGGRSRRMGRDKAAVRLGTRNLLARTCERLAPQCASLAISRHDAESGPCDLGYPIVADGTPEHAGPLAGILAALEWTAVHAPGATHVVTVAVDTPFLPLDLVRRLSAVQVASGRSVACAASGGRVHPVAALWPVSVADDLRRWLREERVGRVLTILDRLGYATADWPTAPCDPFLNVNTPEDLERAERIAASRGDPERLGQ